MCRVLAGLLTLSFLLLGACTDPYRVYGLGFERGIDADILATHDAGTLRNLGLRDTTTLPVI
jgi:hypothetical protein